MKYFDQKSAMKAFYYLIAIDGKITTDELEKLDEVGNEVDPSGYAVYKEDLIAECQKVIEANTNAEEFSEILQESVDDALNETDITERISTRLVIWNMMVLAFSDAEFDEREKKLIRHIARVTEVDNSVLLEMEQILKAYRDILAELEWLEQSSRPYNEIRPHVEEIEQRKQILIRNATELIADEVLAPIPEAILKAKKKQEQKAEFEGKVKAVTDTIQETTEGITEGTKKVLEENVKPKAEAFGKTVKQGAGKLLFKFGETLKKMGENSNKEGGDQ